MGTYIHNENCLTPAMTSNTAPSPNVTSASTEASAAYAAWKAFDQTISTEWSAGYGNAAPWWIKFDFGAGNAEELNSYTISASENSDLYDYGPKTWTLKGSNNDVDWDVLDTQTDVATWTAGEMREYAASSSTAYRYYKLDITAGYKAYVVIGEIELIGRAAASLIDLNVEIKASEEIITDLLSSIDAGSESITDLNSFIDALGQSITDLKSDIEATFTTDFKDLFAEIVTKAETFYDLKSEIITKGEIFYDLKSEIRGANLSLLDLKSEITADAETIYDLRSEIKAANVSLSDLLTEIITQAQKFYDLKTEIKARDYAFYDLKTNIEAVRSKWWLQSSIIAGCSARYSFNTEWNPNRFLMTEIEAKKPHEFSFNTVSGSSYAATSPQIEILTAAGLYPLRTLFLDYLKVGTSNEYNFKLWFSRGISGGTTLKNAKIKAEYINVSDSGGFEIVTLEWISCKVGSGEYRAISETPINLGDILCDSYLDITLKVTCRDCSLSRGLIFFKLIFTGDLRESIFGDKVVYNDGSRYFTGEIDDYTSNSFVCRLYVIGS